MTPINNSDTAWLIVSDYNQDNNLPYEELREDILNPCTNNWYYELYFNPKGEGVGGCNVYNNVGGRGNAMQVAKIVGCMGQHKVGGLGNSLFVGGSDTHNCSCTK